MFPARQSYNGLRQFVTHVRKEDASSRVLQQVATYSTATAAAVATAPFSYHLGASSCNKKSRLRPRHDGHNLFNSSHMNRDVPFFTSIPSYSGEDAFFMSHIARSNRYVLFGIADGVGGWTESGIDPGEFSHGLCGYMANATARPEAVDDLRPQKLLQYGYDRVQADPKIEAGGSTACVAAIQPNGTLEVANLGDSGYVLLRPQRIAYKSDPQTHAFNTPYQLSKLTPRMRAQNAIFGKGGVISETPKDADVQTHQVKHGDVLVFATDGVWDNLSAMDTLAIVSGMMEKREHWIPSHSAGQGGVNASSLRPPKSDADAVKALVSLPAELAYAVTKAAKQAGLDMKRDGPFAREVQKYYPGEDWHGGKHDDIAVIVCVVSQDGGVEMPLKAKL